MTGHVLIAFLLLLALVRTSLAQDASPLLHKPDSPEKAEAQAREILGMMTPEERFEFVCGTGFGIRGIPRLNIPPLNFADASAGLHLLGELSKNSTSTSFPCPLLLAATWNPELADKYGKAVAEEFRAHGMHFILGPGMNIYRSSNNGRNFEYVGEDPFLASRIIAAFVRGTQSVNVATTLKHYLCNETETKRKASNAMVDDRTLHEIYLPAFRAGVESGAWAVMTSYNLLNGEWASQNKRLVTDILRRELGFRSLVMTDWDSTWYGTKLARSGVDLEMPRGKALQRDREQLLGSAEIDRMAVSILKTGIASGLYGLESTGTFKKPEWIANYPAHAALAKEVNERGIILLKNNGILPLTTPPKGTVLVTGNMADLNELAGGGSAFIKGYASKNYLTAVLERFGRDRVVFDTHPSDELIRSSKLVLVFTGWRQDPKRGILLGEHEPTGLSISEREDFNHPFVLPEEDLISRCARLNGKTIVTLACANGVRMDWAGKASGIFLAFYGGQTGADSLMDLMTGKQNPSGKLPFTIERRDHDSPSQGEDDRLVPGKRLADPKDLAPRVAKQSEFLEGTRPGELFTRDLPYREGIFVGYRWYDSKRIEPRFPFGYGLSYTTFKPSHVRVTTGGTAKKPRADVLLTLTNTGKREGSEVVQVYVRDLNPALPRPVRELKGFAKVALKAGESKKVAVTLYHGAFSFWSPEQRKWVVASGPFSLDLGFSSRDLFKTERIVLRTEPK
jgi:beta-glucosidase